MTHGLNTIISAPTHIPLNMSSLEIAELTGKRHDNVLADIRNMLKTLEEAGELKTQESSFEGTYTNKQNKSQPCYNLPMRETLLLVSGYSTELRALIVDRWLELEQNVKPATMGEFLVAQALAFRQAELAQAALTQQVGIVAEVTQARSKK